ncbi:MAG: hypothetical protein WCJ54_08090, partial [Actinomycetota bacterium]
LINQRRNTGTDLLENKESLLLENIVNDLLSPYNFDKSYFFKTLAKRYFYEGRKNKARILQLRAYLKKKSKKNLKDLIYYLRN